MKYMKVERSSYLAARLGIFRETKRHLSFIGFYGPVKKEGKYIFTFKDWSSGKTIKKTLVDPDYHGPEGIEAKVVRCSSCEAPITSKTLMIDPDFKPSHVRCTPKEERGEGKILDGEELFIEWNSSNYDSMENLRSELFECERLNAE